MAAYIDSDDIDAAIGETVRDGLFSDDLDDTHLNRLIALASSMVQQAAHRAGYTGLGATSTSDQVAMATLGQFLNLAYNRKQQELPPAWYEAYNMLERIRTGNLPLTDYTSVNNAGVGGHKFSETNSSVTGARINVFARSKLTGY